MARKTDWAYAAGVVDSDGCIGIYRNRRGNPVRFYYRASVRVTQSDLEALMWFKDNFGGHINVLNKATEKHPRVCWNWFVSDSFVKDFLEGISPYLHIKKPQAELALHFQKSKNGSRDIVTLQAQAILKNKMHDLNQRRNKKEEEQNVCSGTSNTK